jgi:hypothetical protein
MSIYEENEMHAMNIPSVPGPDHAAHAHKAPTPEPVEDPLPGGPVPEEDPEPHPDPVIRDPKPQRDPD